MIKCYDLIVIVIVCMKLIVDWPPGLGHIVAGIYCVLDWTNLGLIPLATVGASKRLPSDLYLIPCMLYVPLKIMCDCHVIELKWNLFIIIIILLLFLYCVVIFSPR